MFSMYLLQYYFIDTQTIKNSIMVIVIYIIWTYTKQKKKMTGSLENSTYSDTVILTKIVCYMCK